MAAKTTGEGVGARTASTVSAEITAVENATGKASLACENSVNKAIKKFTSLKLGVKNEAGAQKALTKAGANEAKAIKGVEGELSATTHVGEAKAVGESVGVNNAVSPALFENQVPYNPRRMEAMLSETYGAENLTSSTLPRMNMPNVRMAGREIVLNMPNGDMISVPLDLRGYIILDNFSIYETRILDSIWGIRDRSLHQGPTHEKIKEEKFQ